MAYHCVYRIKKRFTLAVILLMLFAVSAAVSQAQNVVPDVSLLELTAANLKMDASQLLPGAVVYECHDTVPEGAVIKQDPPAGTLIEATIPVDIVVSTGECDCDCGYSCPVNWRALFLGALALLALIVLAIVGVSGGGDIISPINIFK